MNAIHLRKQLDSETLYLPELKPLIGKTVEIIVREVLSTPFNGTSQAPGWLSPLAGSILRNDDPFGPAPAAGRMGGEPLILLDTHLEHIEPPPGAANAHRRRDATSLFDGPPAWPARPDPERRQGRRRASQDALQLLARPGRQAVRRPPRRRRSPQDRRRSLAAQEGLKKRFIDA